ncbi:MAG: (Fe-S)-binding protein [bacterium]|nr:(Fe-S)-binding protein [bacterium]
MDEVRRELERCTRCGKCRAVCPTFLVTRRETDVARGRIALFESILRGEAAATDRAGEILMGCYRCARCMDVCPSGVRVDMIVQAARELLARRRGLGPAARLVFRGILPRRRLYDRMIALARVAQAVLPSRSAQPVRHLPLIYGGRRSVPRLARRPALRTLPEIIKGKGEIKISLFLGCMLNYVYPEIAASIMRVLDMHGVDIILPKTQVCCGTPVLASGDAAAARALARRNAAALEADKVDAVVFGCASCALTVARDYPRLLDRPGALPDKVFDITEFIDRFLGYSNLPIDETVTYHDPCHLRWGRGVTGPPREVLRRSSDYVEMERAGDCCGLGGSFSLTHYDVSCALGEAKVESIRSSGAAVVATACPGCILQLQDQLARAGLGVPVVHAVQVYEMSYLRGRAGHEYVPFDSRARSGRSSRF